MHIVSGGEMKKIFPKVGEKEVTRAIVEEFAKQFLDYVESEGISFLKS